MLLIQVHRSESAEQPEYLALVDGGNNKTLMVSETYVEGNGLRAAQDLSAEIPGSAVQDLRHPEHSDEPPSEAVAESESEAAQLSEQIDTAQEG